MKYSILRGACLSILILLFWLPAAGAQDVTLFLGGAVPGSFSAGNITTKLDNGHIWGFRLSTSIVPLFGLEHTVAFSSDFLFPKNAADIKDANGFVYNSNAILNLPLGKLSPYGTAGIGLIRQYGSQELPVGTKFAVNYGGGLKARRRLGPLGLRFDARGYSVKGLNIFEFSAGLLISW
jgi:hypothetical protein